MGAADTGYEPRAALLVFRSQLFLSTCVTVKELPFLSKCLISYLQSGVNNGITSHGCWRINESMDAKHSEQGPARSARSVDALAVIRIKVLQMFMIWMRKR